MVTDEMVDAAREAWNATVTAAKGNVDYIRIAAWFVAIEAADRARKPEYRQVTLEDARKLIKKMWNTNGGWTDAETLTKTLLAGMQHIGAVIPDAGK